MYENYYTASYGLFIHTSVNGTNEDAEKLKITLASEPYHFTNQVIYVDGITIETMNAVLNIVGKLDKDSQLFIYVDVSRIQVQQNEVFSIFDLFQITQLSPAKHIAFVFDSMVASSLTQSLKLFEPYIDLWGGPLGNPMTQKSYPVLVRYIHATESLAHHLLHALENNTTGVEKSLYKFYYQLLQLDTPTIYPTFAISAKGSEAGDFSFKPSSSRSKHKQD